MVILSIGIAVGTAIVTGIVSYFAFKPNNEASHHADTTDSKGEIFNNVQLGVEENNSQNNLLVLLVAILVLIKIVELIIFSIKAYQRSIKKKYYHGNVRAITQQQAQQQAQQV